MTVIEFKRGNRGGSRTKSGDLRVYKSKTKSQPGRWRLGFNISMKVLQRCRWMFGDFVKAEYDPDLKQWTLLRVPDEEGNQLTGKGSNKSSASVQFPAEDQHLNQIALGDREGYSCRLVECTLERAVFVEI